MNESEKEKFRLDCQLEYRKAKAANARGLRLTYVAAEFACIAQLYTDIVTLTESSELIVAYIILRILIEAAVCMVLGLLTYLEVDKLRILTDNISKTEEGVKKL